MILKVDLRDSLEIPFLESSSPQEIFQNQTLRPILKLQNEVYLSLFANYVARQKTDFNSLSKSKKADFITQSLQKDLVLKNTFSGITVGMFTLEELENYYLDIKDYNKRIITMVIERLKSQLT